MNTGNKNHYARQVAHLEALLRSKENQLKLVQKENQLLLHKEKALINAIRGIEGSLSAVSKEELVQTAILQHSRGQTPTDSGYTYSAGIVTHQHHSTAGPGNSEAGNVSASCSGYSREATSRTDSSQQVSSSGQGPASTGTVQTTSGMLRQMDAKEDQVQHMLQQLGCCDKSGYTQLYSTWLLQKAMQDPARVVTLLSWTHPERLTYLCKIVAKMALLICKYDANIICPASGSPRDQLDGLVDELFELIIIYGLWEPPSRYFRNLMVNMDTKEFAPYPAGFWQQAIEAIQLSADQRAALKLTWERVKASTDQVTLQCEQLQEQLQQVHAQQLLHNRQFEAAIKSTQERVQQLQQQRRQQEQQHMQQAQQEPESAAAALDSSMQQQPLLQQNLQRLQQLLLQKVQQWPDQGQHGEALQELPQPEPQQLQHGQLSASLGQQPLQEQQRAQSLQQQQVFQQQQAAVGQLHAEWQAEGCLDSAVGLDDVDLLPAADLAAMNQMMQELAAELLLEQQREQQLQLGLQQLLLQQQPQPQQQQLQQQQGWGNVVHASVPAGGVAATNTLAAGQGDGSETSRAAAQLAAAAAAPAAANGADRVLGGCNRASIVFSWHSQELGEAEEVLLQEGTEERRLLERRIQACTDRIKVLFFCQVLQFTNTLSKKQLATLFVHAHPFVPDVVTMCEAMDEMGWDD